jgi:uncharacterized membrane protein (DUF2068 family)
VRTSKSIERDGLLRLIALFKFCKAGLLVTAGLGALELLRPGALARAQDWAAALATSYDCRALQRPIALAGGLSAGRLEALAVAAFLYAGLFATEGVGLWLARRWAEYLTVVATMSLVPLEVYELTRRVSPVRVLVLALNLAVVGYLIHRLRGRGCPGHDSSRSE